MRFIKKTLFITTLSIFTLILLQSSASAQTLKLSKDLSFGDSGEEVSMLQEFLGQNGFFNGEVTGYFGADTQAAVIKYQVENDIEPSNGYVGSLTKEVATLQKVNGVDNGTLSAANFVNMLTSTLDGLAHTRLTNAFVKEIKAKKLLITINPEIASLERYDDEAFRNVESITYYRRNSKTGVLDEIVKQDKRKLVKIFKNAAPLFSEGPAPKILVKINLEKNLKEGFDQIVVVAELKKENKIQFVSQLVHQDSSKTIDSSVDYATSTHSYSLSQKERSKKSVSYVDDGKTISNEITTYVVKFSTPDPRAKIVRVEYSNSDMGTIKRNEGFVDVVTGYGTEFRTNKAYVFAIAPATTTPITHIFKKVSFAAASKQVLGSITDPNVLKLNKPLTSSLRAATTSASVLLATTTTPLINGTYRVTVESLNQSNGGHAVSWATNAISKTVVQIKCDAPTEIFIVGEQKSVDCSRSWSTIIRYENQTKNTFVLATQENQDVRVFVRVGDHDRPNSFDEKVFIMKPLSNNTPNSSTTSSASEEEEDVSTESSSNTNTTQTNTGTVLPNTNTGTTTQSTSTNSSATISDATHKCFARTDIRGPWIPVKCDSKGFLNAAKGNKMAIKRK